MKNIFATIRDIEIDGIIYQWIPVVHIPKYKVHTYFPEQTNRLSELRAIVNDILHK